MKLKYILYKLKKIFLDKSIINITDNLKIYSPNSAGNYKSRASLTLKCANEIFFDLNDLCNINISKYYLQTINIFDLSNLENKSKILELEKLFNKYGSDKANKHNYHIFYSTLFEDKFKVSNVLEIGIGTNNKSIVSTMGQYGNPGASLYAFRDFFENANIVGADVDESILFNDNRISTFHFDQLDPLNNKNYNIENKFDLIIDDGLHLPIANIKTIIFALNKLKDNGYFVVEDVLDESLPIFNLIAFIIKDSYKCKIIKTQYGNLFIVTNKSNFNGY